MAAADQDEIFDDRGSGFSRSRLKSLEILRRRG